MTLHDKQMKVLKHYGFEHQVDKSIEELTELLLELVRFRDGRGSPAAILDELADNSNMIPQLQHHFNISDRMLESVQNEKMDRQLKRIEHVQTKSND